jgi:hypothetical protein
MSRSPTPVRFLLGGILARARSVPVKPEPRVHGCRRLYTPGADAFQKDAGGFVTGVLGTSLPSNARFRIACRRCGARFKSASTVASSSSITDRRRSISVTMRRCSGTARSALECGSLLRLRSAKQGIIGRKRAFGQQGGSAAPALHSCTCQFDGAVPPTVREGAASSAPTVAALAARCRTFERIGRHGNSLTQSREVAKFRRESRELWYFFVSWRLWERPVTWHRHSCLCLA